MNTMWSNNLRPVRPPLWSPGATIELVKEASRVGDAEDLMRLLGNHLAASTSVNGAIVLSRQGLQFPEFNVVRAARRDEQSSTFESVAVRPNGRGGSLAQMLYSGQIVPRQLVSSSPADPNEDLLGGARSILAFPLFEDGEASQMLFLLSPEPHPLDMSDVSELALAVNLIEELGRGRRLAAQLDAAREALDQELMLTGQVQRMLLPAGVPSLPSMSAAVSYHTAKHSGGDYYCLSPRADGKVLLLIADVIGKGAPAAVITAVIATAMNMQPSRSAEPAQVLADLNRQLCSFSLPDSGGFVTAFCAVVDPHEGVLAYARAGHCPPRLLRANGQRIVTLDGAGAVPLGIAPETEYVQETLKLAPGDTLLLYTDGITEARSAALHFFGEHRLDQALGDLPEPRSASSVVNAIETAVSRFVKDAAASDDRTIVAATYTPGEAHSNRGQR